MNKIFNNNNIYFHGTKRKYLNDILTKGFKTRYGRATFTKNINYTLNYTGTKPIKEGLLLVFKHKDIKKAKDSKIILNRKQKVITGWPNRYRTEQFGYYPTKFKKEPILNKKSLLAIFGYNKKFLNVSTSIFKDTIKAKINNKKIKNYVKEIQKILSNKKLQIINPKISLDRLAGIMVYGMINNLVLREIRANYISFLVLNGWKIYNPGQESCYRWLKNKKELINSINCVFRLTNEKFISPTIKKELLLSKKQIFKE